MARLRLTIITTATFLALAAFELSSLAQQQPGGQQRAVAEAGQVVAGGPGSAAVRFRRAWRGLQ